MALAVDAVSSRQAAEAGTTATWSHTCTGSNLVLVVASKNGNGKTISGVTYNSVALTQSVVGTHTADGIRSYIWYLINPATGANNVVITFSASGAEHGSGAVSFTGADQTSPIGATAKVDDASGQSISTTIVTSFANSIILDVWGQNQSGGSGIAVGGSQTSQFTFNSLNPGRVGCSTLPKATAGSQAMTWDAGGSATYASAAVEVKVVQPASVGHKLLTLGVG